MFAFFLSKEIKKVFLNYRTYVFLVLFLTFQSYFFFNLLGSYNLEIEKIISSSKYYSENNISIFEWVIKKHINSINFLLILLGPFFSIYSFGSEYKEGTIQFLRISELNNAKIILSKFIAYFLALFLLLLLCQLTNFLLITNYTVNIKVYLSAFLTNVFYSLIVISSGIFFSLFSKNNILAVLLNILTLISLYMLHTPGEIVTSLSFLNNYSLLWQTESLIKGVIKGSSLIYFLSLTLLFLSLSRIHFNKK